MNIQTRNTVPGRRPTVVVVAGVSAGTYDLEKSSILPSDEADKLFARAYMKDECAVPATVRRSRRTAADIVKTCRRFGIPVKKTSSRRTQAKAKLIGTIEKLWNDFQIQYQEDEEGGRRKDETQKTR